MADLAIAVGVALVVGWVLGMMTAACLGWHRYAEAQERQRRDDPPGRDPQRADEGNERMSEQQGPAIPERGGEPAEAPCRKWRGPFFVSNGRKFSGDCRYCGWPKPDHRAASPTVKEEQK